MPTYEYRCDQCGDSFEIVQSFTEKALRRHAACGGKVEKVFHPRGVVFKGSGFYVTDSRAQAKAASENGESSKSSNGSSKPESSSAGIAADKSAVSSDSGKSGSDKSDSGKSGSGRSDSGKSGSGKSD